MGKKTDIGRIQEEPGMNSSGIRDDETDVRKAS
jgi:hypothetical protein